MSAPPDLTCPSCGRPDLVRYALDGVEFPLARCPHCPLMPAKWDTNGNAAGWRRAVDSDWRIGRRASAGFFRFLLAGIGVEGIGGLAGKLKVGENITKGD